MFASCLTFQHFVLLIGKLNTNFLCHCTKVDVFFCVPIFCFFFTVPNTNSKLICLYIRSQLVWNTGLFHRKKTYFGLDSTVLTRTCSDIAAVYRRNAVKKITSWQTNIIICKLAFILHGHIFSYSLFNGTGSNIRNKTTYQFQNCSGFLLKAL